MPEIAPTLGPTAADQLPDETPGSPLSKSRKACLNCRRQKMKCRLDYGDTCRRCAKAKVPCIFVPRANASYLKDLLLVPSASCSSSSSLINPSQASINSSLDARIKRIESYLGFLDPPDSTNAAAATTTTSADPLSVSPVPDPVSTGVLLPALVPAVHLLQQIAPANLPPGLLYPGTLMTLWATFHEAMPGLHFLPSKQTFNSPCPLLLASMFYCSAVRGAPALAILSEGYLTLLATAISHLCLPPGLSALPGPTTEEAAFQSVLALLLAGVLREAATVETGLWLSLAHRLLLDHCPGTSSRLLEWRCLYSGLQILDLEHASLLLLAPSVPITAPFARLQMDDADHLYRLSCMMHTGLTHFNGRELSTVLGILRRQKEGRGGFTAVDRVVIRDWARQLDEWLGEFTAAPDSGHDRKVVFRQYILHRVFVLSIYHATRGNLFVPSGTGVSAGDQQELLVSARAAVRLHLYDQAIWSNWDLVIITWAALIVLQGVESGVEEEGDVEQVRTHVDKLRNTHEPGGGLREELAQRLEVEIKRVEEGRRHNVSVEVVEGSLDGQLGPDVSGWYSSGGLGLFNESSLTNGYELWQ